MIVDNGGRQSGKSTRALEWAADNERRFVVTFSKSQAQHLSRLAHERGVSVRVLSWHAYLQGSLRGYRDVEVYIDEIGMCLQTLGGSVVGVSGL